MKNPYYTYKGYRQYEVIDDRGNLVYTGTSKAIEKWLYIKHDIDVTQCHITRCVRNNTLIHRQFKIRRVVK